MGCISTGQGKEAHCKSACMHSVGGKISITPHMRFTISQRHAPIISMHLRAGTFSLFWVVCACANMGRTPSTFDLCSPPNKFESQGTP